MTRTSSHNDDQAGESPSATQAIVVGVLLTGHDSDELQDDLDELESLLDTLGIATATRVVQRRQKLSAKCLVGEGKVDEIRCLAEERGAKMVIFDHPLSPPQVRNLEKMTGCEILDRTGVILEIFASHARSGLAKTQVEIAQLEYLLPRMTGAWTHFQRQKGGGVRQRGMGEKQIEVDRRRARERIARLKMQLQGMAKDRQQQSKARFNELKVALVGYTNSGKTTLMNAMTRANSQAQDVLFATLDASMRTLDPTTRPKILLSDTVGFIRNLPHSLIESFKSTLDVVLEADLLLHVIDTSHRNYRAQLETTERVLDEIGAGEIPALMVFNKMDQVDEAPLARLLRSAYKGSIAVSAREEADMQRLRAYIFQHFETNLHEAWLSIPQDDAVSMSLVYKACLIQATDFTLPGMARFHVRAANPVLAKLSKFQIEAPDLPLGEVGEATQP